MYKNLSEMAAHEKGLLSGVVAPKIIFSLYSTVFNRRKQFFPEYSVSLFFKSSCNLPLLNGCCIYFRRAIAAMNCLYTVYLTIISI